MKTSYAEIHRISFKAFVFALGASMFIAACGSDGTNNNLPPFALNNDAAVVQMVNPTPGSGNISPYTSVTVIDRRGIVGCEDPQETTFWSLQADGNSPPIQLSLARPVTDLGNNVCQLTMYPVGSNPNANGGLHEFTHYSLVVGGGNGYSSAIPNSFWFTTGSYAIQPGNGQVFALDTIDGAGSYQAQYNNIASMGTMSDGNVFVPGTDVINLIEQYGVRAAGNLAFGFGDRDRCSKISIHFTQPYVTQTVVSNVSVSQYMPGQFPPTSPVSINIGPGSDVYTVDINFPDGLPYDTDNPLKRVFALSILPGVRGNSGMFLVAGVVNLFSINSACNTSSFSGASPFGASLRHGI